MLRVESLACRRGRRLVFRDLGFALDAGDLLLVTGWNGSGKSSLLRVLAGLLPAEAGGIFWKDAPLDARETCGPLLHYIGHMDAVKPELTVEEMCDYWCALGGGKSSARDVLNAFDLAALSERQIRHLSAGQKRRLALTRLVLNKTSLWLLDEPTVSLDRKGLEMLSRLIAAHSKEGGIAIVATHRADEFPGAKNLALGAGEESAAA